MVERASWATSDGSRRSMKGNRGRDTAPEMAVRRLLHAGGLRYRVNHRPVPGLRRTADIVFTRRKVAVFIDGCFWHSCPIHATQPKANGDFWREKFERNRLRDAETNALLRDAGWTVLRFWEHEEAVAVTDTIRRIARVAHTDAPSSGVDVERVV